LTFDRPAQARGILEGEDRRSAVPQWPVGLFFQAGNTRPPPRASFRQPGQAQGLGAGPDSSTILAITLHRAKAPEISNTTRCSASLGFPSRKETTSASERCQ
jgi:hypothetical protein